MASHHRQRAGLGLAGIRPGLRHLWQTDRYQAWQVHRVRLRSAHGIPRPGDQLGAWPHPGSQPHGGTGTGGIATACVEPTGAKSDNGRRARLGRRIGVGEAQGLLLLRQLRRRSHLHPRPGIWPGRDIALIPGREPDAAACPGPRLESGDARPLRHRGERRRNHGGGTGGGGAAPVQIRGGCARPIRWQRTGKLQRPARAGVHDHKLLDATRASRNAFARAVA